MEKTNIIVIGAAGRMGKMIASLAEENKGFHLQAVVDVSHDALSVFKCESAETPEAILAKDHKAVVIDFTAPAATMACARSCARYGVPMVIGTTGFPGQEKDELEQLAKITPILWSANMSIGVNVLMEMLPRLASALGEGYDIEMVEIHHGRKKDAPSGTALMLADVLATARGWDLDEVEECCREGLIGERPADQIGIQSVRGGDVVGVHTIYFLGAGEMIEVKHQAESRENFARGALRAAKWLQGKPAGRLYSMQDVISGGKDK